MLVYDQQSIKGMPYKFGVCPKHSLAANAAKKIIHPNTLYNEKKAEFIKASRGVRGKHCALPHFTRWYRL
jgi:hypothetical protein